MKKTILLTSALIFIFSACSIKQHSQTIENASKNKMFQGLDKHTKFSTSFPNAHNGVYQEVIQFDFVIKSGLYRNKNASSILVKKDNKWQVIKLYVQINEEWVLLKKANEKESE